METAIVFIMFLLVFVLDFRPNAKRQNVKYKIVYCLLCAISLAVLSLYSVGIMLPGPTELIKSVIDIFIKPSG